MGADVLDTPTVRGLGDVVNGIVHTSGGYPEPGSKHEDFNKRFKAATGTEADTNYVVNGCDIALMIDAAVTAAGSTDPKAVRDALANLKDSPGNMSNFTFAGTDRMPLRAWCWRRSRTGRRPSSAANWRIPRRCPRREAAAMLSVEGLVVRYGPIEAVRGIGFQVKRGEVFALLGANGAGKSSTLAAIAGLVKPASGAIAYDGRPVNGLPPETLSRAGIGLVPEGRRIFASLTVAENLWLGGAAHGSATERYRLQQEMEERFPILRERTRQKAGLLSGGEQQMLAIARALMTRPKLLLLDEPSLGLAPQMVEKVFDLIASLRKEGHTILLVEQNVPMSLEIADRGIVLANGRIAVEGSGAELLSNSGVTNAYLAA